MSLFAHHLSAGLARIWACIQRYDPLSRFRATSQATLLAGKPSMVVAYTSGELVRIRVAPKPLSRLFSALVFAGGARCVKFGLLVIKN